MDDEREQTELEEQIQSELYADLDDDNWEGATFDALSGFNDEEDEDDEENGGFGVLNTY